VRAFYKATRLDPLSPLPWKNLAEIYRENKRTPSARRAYKKALALDPTDQDMAAELAACYLRQPK
jgi:Flp pilus assembly protein TadD